MSNTAPASAKEPGERTARSAGQPIKRVENWLSRWPWIAKLFHGWQNLGLTSKMAIQVAIGLSGLLAIFGFLGVWTARQAIQQTMSDRVLLARQSAAVLDSQLAYTFDLLEIIAGQLDLQNLQADPGTWQKLQEKFEIVITPQASPGAFPTPAAGANRLLFLLDAQGQEILRPAEVGRPEFQWKQIDWRQVAAFQEARLGQPRSISLLAEASAPVPAPGWIVLVVPRLPTQSEGGVTYLAAVINLSSLSYLLSNPPVVESRPGFFLFGNEYNDVLEVINSSGTILYSSNLAAGKAGEITTAARSPGGPALLSRLFSAGQPGVETCLGCEPAGISLSTGSDLESPLAEVIAFAPLRQAPWGVILRQPTDELFAPARRLAITNLVLGAVAVLGALVLVRVTTGSVIKPIQQLTHLSQQIAVEATTSPVGEPSLVTSRPGSGKEAIQQKLDGCFSDDPNPSTQRGDEIGALARSFAQMCVRLQQSLAENRQWVQELDVRVQERTQELAILNAITLTASQSLDLNTILERSLEQILSLTGVDAGAIYLQTDSHQPGETGSLQLMAHRGFSEATARLASQVGLLDGNCGGVVEHGRVVVVPDLKRYHGRRARSLQLDQLQTLIHIPLTAHGAPLGSMCIGTRQLHEFEIDEQNLLTAIGRQIAVAVENARLYQELQQKEQLLSELLRKALAAQEEERKRIARELHDEISQAITALMFAAEAGLDGQPPAELRSHLQNIINLAGQTLEAIHQLIFDLRPSILDHLGLVPAIRWLVNTRLEPRGIRVMVDAQPAGDSSGERPPQARSLDRAGSEQPRLPAEIEVALYRIVQEAVTNIQRHSGARNVEIFMHREQNSAGGDRPREQVFLRICDDGIGFKPAELEAVRWAEGAPDPGHSSLAENARGLGVLGMQERVELLGGEFALVSAPGQGTQIEISVPLAQLASPRINSHAAAYSILPGSDQVSKENQIAR